MAELDQTVYGGQAYVDPVTGKLSGTTIPANTTTKVDTGPVVAGTTVTPTDLNTSGQKFKNGVPIDVEGNYIAQETKPATTTTAPSPYGSGSALAAATGASKLTDIPITDPGALGQYGAQINVPGVPIANTAANISALGGALGVGTKSPYVSPEATVAHQLDILLNKDSPYMRVAAAKSKGEAEGKGLLSSSMAVGAGRKAAIETALPIATADAGTYATSDINRQTQVMQSALQAQGAAEASNLSTQQFGQEGALQQSAAYDNLKALKTQGRINYEIEQMGQQATDRRLGKELDTKMWVSDQQISADMQVATIDALTNRSNQHSANVTNILTNPNFKTEDDMLAALDIEEAGYNSDMDFIASSIGAGIEWKNVGAEDKDEGSGSEEKKPGITTPDGKPVVLTGTDLRNKTNVIEDSVGTPYESLASVSHTDPTKFGEALGSTGIAESPEYQNYSSISADGTVESADINWSTFSTLMFAALNPENAEAQAAARAALVDPGTGHPIKPYLNIEALTPAEKKTVPIWQTWINENVYQGVPPAGGYTESSTTHYYTNPDFRNTVTTTAPTDYTSQYTIPESNRDGGI